MMSEPTDPLAPGFPSPQAERSALQEAYREADPQLCGAHHHNLSVYLEQARALPDNYLAHRLAAGVLFFQANSAWLTESLGDLAMAYLQFWPHPPFPSSFAELCLAVEAIEGVHFGALVESLGLAGGADAEEAFRAVLGTARRIAQEMRNSAQP